MSTAPAPLALTVAPSIAPAAPAAVASGFHIPGLDGIRGIAVSMVFLSHAGLGHLVSGSFGVTIFFFLSGFLITALLRRELDASGRISIRDFYLRRTLRIFPPFYIVLGLCLLLHAAGGLPGIVSSATVAAQALYAGNYLLIVAPDLPRLPGSTVLWSLAVEEHFYLLYPLLMVFLLPRYRAMTIARILLGLCAAVLLWRCVLTLGFGAGEDRIAYATDTRIDSILFGCILGLTWSSSRSATTDSVITKRQIALVLFAGVALLGSLLWRDDTFRHTARYTVQGLALYPLFRLVLNHPRLPALRWLNWRWLQMIGIWSYVLYLVHRTALNAIAHLYPEFGTLRVALAAAAASLAIAIVLHHLVERPCAILRRRLHRA